jgi:hypothetical protein
MEKLDLNFGKAITHKDSIPEFSIAPTMSKYGELFYELLKTNESIKEFAEMYDGPKLKGTYVGIGFGMSFALMAEFFEEDYQQAYFVDREPYVYFIGKISLELIRRCHSGQELFLSILDIDSFNFVYQDLLEAEPDDSPLFLRQSKKELQQAIPEEMHQLRKEMFNIRHNKLSSIEHDLFVNNTDFSIEDKVAWIKHFMRYKAGYLPRKICQCFEDLQKKAPKILPVCADIFHPDLWNKLAEQKEQFEHPSMINFSNAAVYSVGVNLRNDAFSTSNYYKPELFDNFPGAKAEKHYFAYAERRGHYVLTYSKNIPSHTQLLESFEKKSKSDASKPKSKSSPNVSKPSKPKNQEASKSTASKVPFRLGGR